MIEYISNSPSLTGVIIGFSTFLIIGLFHPLVVKGEFYFGVRIWIAFLVAGILFLTSAFFVDTVFVASLLSILGFSSFWSIHEVFAQKKRVERGWFPQNPHRKCLRKLFRLDK